MKHYLSLFTLCLFLATSCVQESIEEPKMGTVSFSKVTFEHFGNVSPNGRIAAESEWKHIFAESATLLITNKATGQEYTLEYDPNDFTKAYQIQLPFGEYTVISEVEGDDFETFLPFTISGEFTLDETSLDISLQGNTEYGLVTVKKEFVQSANLDGTHELVVCEHDKILYLYVKAGLSPTLTIYENFNGQTLQKELAISPYNHYHHYLKLTESQGIVNFIELAIGPFEYHEEYFEIDGKNNDGTVTDADGNVYGVIKIGEQYWMAEELRATTYCDGSTLNVYEFPQKNEDISNQDNLFWRILPELNKKIFYYNNDVVLTDKNICPCNWHISTDEDWKILERYLGIPESDLTLRERGMDQLAGTRLKAADWNEYFPGQMTSVSNRLKFDAYPTGTVEIDIMDLENWIPGSIYLDPEYAYWWSPGNDKTKYRRLNFSKPSRETTSIYNGNHPRIYFPIRCVKD